MSRSDRAMIDCVHGYVQRNLDQFQTNRFQLRLQRDFWLCLSEIVIERATRIIRDPSGARVVSSHSAVATAPAIISTSLAHWLAC